MGAGASKHKQAPTRGSCTEQNVETTETTSPLDLQRELREKAREETKQESKYKKLYNDIKEDLMTYYRENESQIPAAPLVEEHNVALEDLYVIPPMWAYDKSYEFGPDTERYKGLQSSVNDPSKRHKATLSQIFSSGDVRYRKIYITANAGYGKTSLSQKLTMTWCQAQFPLESLTEKYKQEELDAMKDFEFLFLLHLRDYQSENKCNLDDLIMQMVAENLSRYTLYTQAFLQRLLHENKCLIVIDGLDEWVHPVKCNKKPAVPHNNHPNSCTIITTSRPWKLGTIGLSKHHIDRHVEIAELDDETLNQLLINAVQVLDDNQLNLAGKDESDFSVEIRPIKIDDIICIPYILLQLTCLFFGGLPIGKSKCEIYSNITELTLKRGLNKKNLPDINVQSNYNSPVPNCMRENETCKLYISLIMKLGKLAFFTLFTEKKESSLIFDSKVVTQYMTKQEIDFCFKVGLLCQTKDNTILAERRFKVFFQHKSVQEFFSAIYICSEWENNTVKLAISNACSSIACTLDMSNVFVFVCGMNQEVYTCISDKLQEIVEQDEVTSRNRSDMYSPWKISVYCDDRKTMKSYQLMQLQCFQESVRNGNENCSVKLYDIVVDDSLTEDDLTALQTMISLSNGNVKSLRLERRFTEDDLTALQTMISLSNGNVKSLRLESPDEKIGNFVTCLDAGMFTSLGTLRVEGWDKEPVWLANILTEYTRKLKCLTLSGPSVNKLMSLDDFSKTALTGLTCLQALYLAYVHMTHCNLERLYAYISQATTLTQLKLVGIHCSDHENQGLCDCDVTLDLRRLNKMNMIHLCLVPCRKLHVKSTCLKKFEFESWEEMTVCASSSLLEDLSTAPLLTLGLGSMPSSQKIQIKINHTLTQLQDQLQYLWLADIDMGDVIPQLTPAMTKLERLNLEAVTLSSAAWTKLFNSVGQLPQNIIVKLSSITMTSKEWTELMLAVGGMPQVLTVEVEDCEGPSREEWTAIVDVIKSTPTLSLLQDFSINDDGRASLTLKKISN